MTAFDYARSRSTAERLIKRFGQSASLVQSVNSGTEYNPTQTETSHAVTVAVLGYKDSDIDGTLIQTSDRLVYLSTEGLSVAPSQDDSLAVGGDTLQVIEIKPLSPAGTVVFYKLQCRAA